MISSLLSFALAVPGLVFAQDSKDAKPAAPQQQPAGKPATPAPAQGQPAKGGEQPAPAQQQPPLVQQPPQPPDQPLGKIKDYRGGSDGVPYIRRLEDVRDFDFTNVDFDAPVIAVVDGTPVTKEEYQLWLAFSSGQQGVRAAQLQRLTEQAVKRIAAEGGDVKRYEVTDADVDAKLKGEEEQARAQGEQALADYKKLVEETLGGDRYRKLIRANLMSEKLLLPPIEKVEGKQPEGLPLESAQLLEDRTDLRDYLNNAYMSGADFPAMFRNQFLIMLQEAQVSKAKIDYAIESKALPAGVYMTIGGEPVTTAEILDFVPNTPDTRDLAMRLLLVYRAIDRELEKNNAKLTNEQFQLMFEAHEAEYKNTLFPLQNLIRLRGFMTMPEYREYYRRRAAYQQWEAAQPEMKTDDALRAHHEKYGLLFYENGKVTLDVLWAGLTEAEAKTKGDLNAAWKTAFDHAIAMLGDIKAGKPIDQVRTAQGDTFPVDPTGKLLAKTRNELRNFLGETEYTIFVNGYSLADDIFYNRVEGEMVGPMKANRTLLPGMKSRMGYIVAQVVDFKKNSVKKQFDQQRQMVEQDFYDLNFTYFAHQALKDSKIELTMKK